MLLSLTKGNKGMSVLVSRLVVLIKTIGKIILSLIIFIIFLMLINDDSLVKDRVLNSIPKAKAYEKLINDNRQINGKLDSDYFVSGDINTFTYNAVIAGKAYRGKTQSKSYPTDFDNVILYYLPSDPSIISIDPVFDSEQNAFIKALVLDTIVLPFIILFSFIIGLYLLWGKKRQ